MGDVISAGLGLPVVVAANPAILGETAHAAGWFSPGEGADGPLVRPGSTPARAAGQVWSGSPPSAPRSWPKSIAPLVPPRSPMSTIYGPLPEEATSDCHGARRTASRSRCSIAAMSVDGEHFLVQGQADVALDRPVTTNGVLVPTPTTQGTLLLHQFDGTVTAMLGATIEDERSTHQFALRNALVWTSAPSFIFVRGELLSPGPAQIDAGNAQLLFGVYEWAPTLPDPYVSNAFIRRARDGGCAAVPALGRVSWSTPDRWRCRSKENWVPTLPSAGGTHPPVNRDRPAKQRGDPDVGLTQVEQDRLTFDRSGSLLEGGAAEKEQHEPRPTRQERADRKTRRSARHRSMASCPRWSGRPHPACCFSTSRPTRTCSAWRSAATSIRDANTSGITRPQAPSRSSGLAVHSQVAGMRVIALAAGAVGAGANAGRRPGHHDDGVVPDAARLGDGRRRHSDRGAISEVDADHSRGCAARHLRCLHGKRHAGRHPHDLPVRPGRRDPVATE